MIIYSWIILFLSFTVTFILFRRTFFRIRRKREREQIINNAVFHFKSKLNKNVLYNKFETFIRSKYVHNLKKKQININEILAKYLWNCSPVQSIFYYWNDIYYKKYDCSGTSFHKAITDFINLKLQLKK